MWALGGTAALGQGLLLLATPILARLYGPAAFGVFASVLSWVGLVAPAAGGRFDAAIPAARSVPEALRLLYTSIRICTWTAPLVGIAIGVANVLGGSPGAGAIVIGLSVAVLVFLGHLGIALRYWHTRLGNYSLLGWVGVQQGLVRAVAPMALGLLGGSWLGLAGGEVLSRLAGTRVQVGKDPSRRWRALRAAPRQAFRRVLRDFGEFPRISVPSVLLDAAAITLPVPLAFHYYGPAVAGVVGMGMRLTLAPVALVGRAVADVYHAELGHAARRSGASARRLFTRVAVGLAVTGLIGFGPIHFFAADWIPAFLGEQWRAAVPAVRAFVPWGFAAYVVGPLSRSLMVLGDQRLKLFYDVGSLVGVVGVFIISALHRRPAEVALMRMAWVYVSMYGVLLAVLIWKHRRLESA